MVFVKNLPRLIESFVVFLQKFPNFVLRLVGDGPERENIEQVVKNNNLEGKIIISPSVSHTKLLKIFTRSIAVVLPSLSEVSSNTLADAVRLGVPFIASKHIGWPQKIESCGIFIDPLSNMEIVEALKKMVDPESRENYSVAAKKYDRLRPWDNVASEYLALFRQ
jgi:glycosyltransferase involved in cell wall biosynthesis